MLNAFNALSENGSLVQMPPWRNPYLIVACAFSTSLHCVILYVPQLATIFGVGALTFEEWLMVFCFAVPVIFIDEILKFGGRYFEAKELRERMKSQKSD